MSAIADIFREFGAEYMTAFADRLPAAHKKVIEAIIKCRTEICGSNVFICQQCHRETVVFRSCGNRHCPVCQNHKTRQWLEKQMERQLPGHHFMITFTVPEQLRHFIRSRQKIAYAALFAASSATLKKLVADDQFVGGDCPGFFGVLHTWGRQLEYHPHIHYIVPGGALNRESGFWHSSRVDFFLPVRALSEIFRAKFRDEMKKTGLLDQINPDVWQMAWNVNSQAVGSSEGSLKYLAPYVFKVAISDSRVVGVNQRQVTFRYKKQRSARWRTMSLDVMEFIRRYLQHVLPHGFMKIRYYGFLGSGSSITSDDVRDAIELSLEFFAERHSAAKKERKPAPYCPHCRGTLIFCYAVDKAEAFIALMKPG